MGLTIRTEFDEDAARELFGLDANQLSRRFAAIEQRGHWVAYDEEDTPAGIAVAAERPDGRVFVTHRLKSEQAFLALLDEALRTIAGPVNVTIDADQLDRLHDVQSLGMRQDLSSVSYDVPFAGLLEALPTPRGAGGFDLVRADDVDPDELLALDTELRSDVPGNDGWRGNRSWFDDELRSAEFDPNGYVVATDPDTGDPIGLCRMWRNQQGPTLGMLGVRRHRRHGFVALGLLRAAVVASSDWGWPTFTTHTARPELQRHLQRVGARPSGGFRRFTRP